MTTLQKLRRQKNRIIELLDAPPDTLVHVGSDTVIKNLKNRLKVINKKIGKLKGKK